MRNFSKDVERKRALKLAISCFDECKDKYGEANAKWAMQKVVNDQRRLAGALKEKKRLEAELDTLNKDLSR